MKKKIFAALITLLITVLTVFTLLWGMIMSEELKNQASDALKSIRVTILTGEGEVAFDNMYDEKTLANHMDREEVIEASRAGHGQSQRFSDTTGATTYNYAVKLKDDRILRMSLKADRLSDVIYKFLPAIGVSFIMTFVVAFVLSSYLTERLIRPINNLNLDYPDAGDYEELLPLVERIRHQNEEIAAAELHRKEFSANVSHELKTPLTTIIGYSELLAKDSVKEGDIIPFSEKINSQAKRLLNIINDIISLSEFDEGKKPKEFEKTNPHILVENVFDQLRDRALEKGVKLNFLGMDNINIMANPSLLESMIFNLVDNGIKYNKRGGQVDVSVASEGEYVKVIVSDTGIGIPQDHRSHIFERFYLVDKSRSKKTGGTGLGLSIVKHIAEHHGGYVKVQSRENEGTTFICYIKRRENPWERG